MSYDIWLEVDAGGPEPLQVGESWNYTSNGARLWEAAGLDLAAAAGRTAVSVAADLDAALIVLRADAARFEALNPPNGGGSYATLLPALDTLRAICRAAPYALVRVWR